MNFGGLPDEYSNYNSSEIVIIPVAYDGTSTWIKGADKGPFALLQASENMELYDIETNSEVYYKGIHTLSPVTNIKSPDEIVDVVEKKITCIFADGKFPVLIGGEHSVSIGAFKSAGKAFKDLSILQFDAHADLRDEYEGSKFNHACVMARAMEIAPIVQAGIRSMSVEEKGLMNKKNVFFAHRISEKRSWIHQVSEKLNENVYITLDLDVFDPSIMPSTGTPEPNGMSYREVLNALKYLIDHHNIVGIDIVELCPDKSNKAPDFLAAKLIYQFLSHKFLR
ncbi:MAG: agmatinase [Bacteroidales bacterium]|nr:agmatinase [Bacteroidales bacterium]